MSFDAYNRLVLYLILAGMAVLVVGLVISVISHPVRHSAAPVLMMGSIAVMGSAVLANCACGIQHKQMKVRGTLLSYEESGLWFYFCYIPVHLVLGIGLLSIAICSLVGVIPNHL